MKQSLYNIVIQTDGDQNWLLNSFNRAAVAISKEDCDLLKENRPISQGGEDALRAVGGLVEDPSEQQTMVFKEFDRVKSSKSELTVVVPLTSRCNLACGYCYQVIHGNFQGERSSRPPQYEWNKEGITALRNFCHRELEENEYEALQVRWYGGEPLLRLRQMDSIGSLIKSDAEQLGKRFSGMIVTNGTLLGKDSISQLKRLNVSRLEISLDGPATTHNVLRPIRNGKGSYQSVLAGILAAAECFSTVILRVNVHSKNVDHLGAWLSKIALQVADLPVYLKLKLVEGDSTNDLTWSGFCTAVPALLSAAKSHGMKLLQTSLVSECCPAIRTNYYIIQSDLKVYKCPQNLGSANHVGTITAAGELQPTSKLVYWTGYDVRRNHGCNSCAHLPHCNGGCPYNEIMGNISAADLLKYSRQEHCCVEKLVPEAFLSRLF